MANDEIKCATNGCSEIIAYTNTLGGEPVWVLAENYIDPKGNNEFVHVQVLKPHLKKEQSQRKASSNQRIKHLAWPSSKPPSAMSADEFTSTLESLKKRSVAENSGICAGAWRTIIVHKNQFPIKIKCKKCQQLRTFNDFGNK